MRFASPLLLTAVLLLAACSKDSTTAPAATVADLAVQDLIALPIRPEAIALGNGTTFYAGSSAASRWSSG